MCFSDLPYEIIYNIYDYIEFLEDLGNFLKSFNKEIYKKGLLYGKKYVIDREFFPLEIINSKLFSTSKFNICSEYWKEDLELLNNIEHEMKIFFNSEFRRELNFNDYSKYITGVKFSSYIHFLPRLSANIEHLHISSFAINNQKMKDFSESNLIELELGHGLDNQIILPEKIERLKINNAQCEVKHLNDLKYFTFAYVDVMPELPKNLIHLEIKEEFASYKNVEPIDLHICDKIETLIIKNKRLKGDIYLSANLKKLQFDCSKKCFKNLPEKIDELYWYSINEFDFNNVIIKKLYFSRSNNPDVDKLPDCIEELRLASCFNKIITKFPKNLKKIIFSEKYKSIFLRSKLNFQNIHVEFYTYDYIYD